MNLDKGKITGAQFMFLVACFIQASALLTPFFVGVTKQDSWVAVITALVICIPLILIFVTLMKKFPGQNLVSINNTVFGPILGRMVSILYIWFFLTLSSLNLRDLADFIQKTIMRQTPGIIICLLFMAACTLAVRHGIAVVARYSVVFTIVSVIVVLLVVIFTIKQMNLQNFLPAFAQKPRDYFQASHIAATIPFGETVAFLMIAPSVKVEPKKLKKLFISGFLIGGITLLIVVLNDNAVLGPALGIFALPSFETQRIANLTQTLSRLEVLFAIVLIVLLFSKVTLLFYVSVLAIAQFFNMDSYKPLVLSIAATIITYSFITYSSIMEHNKSASEITPILWTIFEFLLPTITLIVASLKKSDVKKKEEAPA